MIGKKKNILLIVISLITFAYFVFAVISVSIPGDSTYFAKHEFQKYLIDSFQSNKDKASERLKIISALVQKFDKLASKNSKDKHLVPLADEIIFQSNALTADLTKMKDGGQSVKKEAEEFCEALEKQEMLLGYLTKKADSSMQKDLQRVTQTTHKYVKQAMMWE